MSTNKVHTFTTLFFGWKSIDWKLVFKKVRLLQNRIVKAVKCGKFRKVKSLQWILTRSFFAKLWAVKLVTQSKGKNTPGVDGVIWSTDNRKWKAVHELNVKGYKAKPLKRVFIPKSNGKKRPLAIPTIKDRAMQMLFLLAVDPVHEVLSDLNSYGFRKARACQDAIQQGFLLLSNRNAAQWILEADIKSCFDEISHQWLMKNIPINKKILNQWLKAGIIKNNSFAKTKKGTPQGGVISPLFANFTLDGLERRLRLACSISLDKHGHTKYNPNKVNLIRYADDLIITAKNKEYLKEVVKPTLVKFLLERGLTISVEKTKITHISNGFDFLGHSVRKYNGLLLTKPSKKSVNKIKRKVRNIINNNKAASQENLIRQLNPVIRGWANFFKASCASKSFSYIDQEIHLSIWKWCKRRHNQKNQKWISDKYFHKIGNRNWVFAAKTDKNELLTLFRMSSININRHVKIINKANVYDKEFNEYFRKRKTCAEHSRSMGKTYKKVSLTSA